MRSNPHYPTLYGRLSAMMYTKFDNSLTDQLSNQLPKASEHPRRKLFGSLRNPVSVMLSRQLNTQVQSQLDREMEK